MITPAEAAAKRKNKVTLSMARSVYRSLKTDTHGLPWEAAAGYSLQDLKTHLAALFQTGMNWENYGEWHLDHIIPLAVFSYDSVHHSEFKQCWAVDNLQPLWARDNMRKHASIGVPRLRESHLTPEEAKSLKKACTVCSETKTLDQFARDSRTPTGRTSRCKVCNRRIALEGKRKRQAK